jgi:cytochrome c
MTLTGDAVLIVGDPRGDVMARLIVKRASRSIYLVVRALRNHASGLAFAILMTAASEGMAQEADGERLFRQRCSSCHSLEAGQNRAGPSLAGVSGRTAGTVEGARYSPALRDSNVVWNAQTLDSFLTNPRQFVRGTTMAISVTNENQRRALVDFLTTR